MPTFEIVVFMGLTTVILINLSTRSRLESTEYSNKHVGKRYWSTTTAVMLLYDVPDKAIWMAVNDSRVFGNIKGM